MLSWRIIVLLLVPDAVVMALATLAWRCVLPERPGPFRRLFVVRLAGEALNTGTLSVGGEPVKAYLLRPFVPFVDASAAQFVDKTSITVAQLLFLALALAVATLSFDVAHGFLWAMAGLLVIQMALVTGFILLQRAGIVRISLRIARRLGVRGIESRLSPLIRLERTLVTAYRDRPSRVLSCVVFHLLGWVVGSLEIYLLLGWIGVDVSFSRALVIDAFGAGLKSMAFMVPGAIGALEGGYMLAFGALGVEGALGLSSMLIRRLRVMVWGVLGLLVLVIGQPPVPTTSSRTCR
jgi:uncharacterized protein (TIRG00374 family)